VADDQPVVRAGFAALLSAQADLEVVGQAADGAALVDLVLEHRPEVAVVDVRMPVVEGIEACRRMAAAGVGTRLLVVTTFDLDAYVYDALRAGASGFVLKDVPAARLVEAVGWWPTGRCCSVRASPAAWWRTSPPGDRPCRSMASPT